MPRLSSALRSAAQVIASLNVVIALLALFGVNALLWILHAQYEEDIRRAALKNLQTIAFSVAAHADQVFSQADTQIRRQRMLYVEKPEALPDFYRISNHTVDRNAYPLEAVIKGDGFMYLSSTYPDDLAGAAKVNLGDREHFIKPRDNPADELFVSRPLVGRVSGQPVLNVSRRMEDNAHRFQGVSVVSVSPRNFVYPYLQLIGDSGVVAIYGRDGVARVREPAMPTVSATVIQSQPTFPQLFSSTEGNFIAKSPVDGVTRAYAFKQLKLAPLVVLVGYSLEDLSGIYPRLRSPINYDFILANAALLVMLVFAAWSSLLRLRLANTNRRLTLLLNEAAQSEQAKSQLIASVSHELRTPLHAITGNAQILMASLQGAERDAGRSIFSSARHLNEIVNELLDVAKAESGQFDSEVVAVDLSALVGEILQAQQPVAKAKSVSLKLDDRLPAAHSFHGSRTALSKIFYNLIDNAIKFTEVGSVTVRLDATADGVAVEVQDTGIGIPEQFRESMFEPFAHTTTPPGRQTPGAGLGMALTYRLVNAMGGSITIDSTVNVGTVVKLTLKSRSAQ